MATATMAAFQAMRISPVNAAVTSNTTSSVNSRVTLNSALQTVSCSRVGFSASGLFASRIASKKPTHQTVETRSVTVVAEKKYKVKTHKASAKRFRVTGSGKVVRRQAWRAHLLQKKSLRRKNRLAGMVGLQSSSPRILRPSSRCLKVETYQGSMCSCDAIGQSSSKLPFLFLPHAPVHQFASSLIRNLFLSADKWTGSDFQSPLTCRTESVAHRVYPFRLLGFHSFRKHALTEGSTSARCCPDDTAKEFQAYRSRTLVRPKRMIFSAVSKCSIRFCSPWTRRQLKKKKKKCRNRVSAARQVCGEKALLEIVRAVLKSLKMLRRTSGVKPMCGYGGAVRSSHR